jgi:hypothetical protein
MHAAACFGLLHASVFTLALASNDWVQFPGGRLLHTSCIHRHEAGRIEPLAPCQHVHALAAPSVGSGYYGGWSVYSLTDVAAATGELDVITLRLRVETGHW